MGPHIRAVREPGVPLLFARLKPKPPELANELIPEVIVASSPSAGIPWAGMRVVSLRVVPAAGIPSSSPAPSARPACRLEGHPEPEPDQGRVLAIEETEPVLRRGNREPNARPGARTIPQAGPLRRGYGALEAVAPLAVHCQRQDPLMPAEALGHGPCRGPIHRHRFRLRR